jgi:ABC-type dipeptide/oligopeptide/nickel transport system permease component
MNPQNLTGFSVLLVLSLAVAFAIWVAVSKSLQSLLNQTLKIPDGTTFYLRSFLTGLLLAALAGGFDVVFDFKPGSPFMEYAWRVASGLENVLSYSLGFLLVYLVLVTVLAAVLRAKHEQ